jgi:hypothetical protein
VHLFLGGFPIESLHPIQAMKNKVDVGLTKNNNELTCVLGLGAMREVMNTIGCCFNMDGVKPTGQNKNKNKVALLDCHHLWAYLMDPFTIHRDLRFSFLQRS